MTVVVWCGTGVVWDIVQQCCGVMGCQALVVWWVVWRWSCGGLCVTGGVLFGTGGVVSFVALLWHCWCGGLCGTGGVVSFVALLVWWLVWHHYCC